jgi:hypothetical protein
MSYTMVRLLGRRDGFGSAATDLALAEAQKAGGVIVDAAGKGTLDSPSTYGQFARSIAMDVVNNPAVRNSLSPVSGVMLDMGATAAGTIAKSIAGGDSFEAMAEQIAWIMADIIISVVKDVVKDVLSVVPVLGPIVNIIIDVAAGAAKAEASHGKSGEEKERQWESQRTQHCMLVGAIAPTSWAGITTPADILTPHSGPYVVGSAPANTRMTALGRAIDAIVFPTAADLSAIAWYAQPKQNRLDITNQIHALLMWGVPLAELPQGSLGREMVLEASEEANSCNYIFSMHRTKFAPPIFRQLFVDKLVQFNVPALVPEVIVNGCISGRISLPPSRKDVEGALVRSTAAPVYAIPPGELLTMQKLVRAIQSQYIVGKGVTGEGGAELWPILMDLLLHQIKSGQINDAALSILFSRHSEENCYDYNPGISAFFYGAIDSWNEQQHPRTDSQKKAFAKQFADAQMLQRTATLAANRTAKMKFTSPTFGAMVACVKAKGTWNAKYKTCTTTRAGKIAVMKYNPVTKALVAPTVTKPNMSPIEAILAGAVVAAGVVVAVKIVKKRRAKRAA